MLLLENVSVKIMFCVMDMSIVSYYTYGTVYGKIDWCLLVLWLISTLVLDIGNYGCTELVLRSG